jgi:eukaryotic-like serine/threonine-protein kinase
MTSTTPPKKRGDNRLGPFVLLDEIQGSSSARVFRARYAPKEGQLADVVVGLRSSDVVVVRMLRDAAVRDAKLVNSFTRDGELLGMIDHPNVARAYTRGVTNGRMWHAAEYIEGNTLRALFRLQHRDELRMRPEVALVVALDVLAGLAAAQSLLDPRSRSLGLIHRHLSPDQVLLSIDGAAKLTDVDGVLLSLREEPDWAEDSGVPGYMAPEAARQEQLTQNSDVYAVGVMLFGLLTGRPAFAVESLPHQSMLQVHRGNERAPWPKGQDLPLDVIHLVDQLTDGDPDQRPRDAAAAYALVEGLLHDPDEARMRLAIVARDLALSDGDRPLPLFAHDTAAMGTGANPWGGL